MKFSKLKTILVNGLLTSLFVGAIFVSCHSRTITNTHSAGNSLVLPIAQSLNEPCCMTQGSNHSLHFLPLAAIAPTTPSPSNILVVSDNPVLLNDTATEGLHISEGLNRSRAIGVPLYNYLTSFIAQGLLQPLIYNTIQASA